MSLALNRLTDEELARIARAEVNDLTSTPLELELLSRFEKLLDASGVVNAIDSAGYDPEDAKAILDNASEFDIDAKGIQELGEAMILNTSNSVDLLKAIGEAGFDSPQQIKTEFELAQQFRALANDAGEAFTRLSELSTTATA